MRYGGLGQDRTAVEADARPTAAPSSVKEIPYDYVATFAMTGIASRRLQDVITVSTEGSFIAVSIGYSFVPRRFADPVIASTATGMSVNGLDISALGFPLDLIHAISEPGTPPSALPSAALLQSVVQTLIARQGIDFKYSVVDSGSGRELQNQAIHNIAGLGIATGDRPFRPFAKPALFLPRSTIRIEVEELSEGPLYAGGTLFMVLHGYKRLGE